LPTLSNSIQKCVGDVQNFPAFGDAKFFSESAEELFVVLKRFRIGSSISKSNLEVSGRKKETFSKRKRKVKSKKKLGVCK
jgi:hypothetical protein